MKPRRKHNALWIACLIALAGGAGVSHTQTPQRPQSSARDVEVRSYLGDPLNLRVALPRIGLDSETAVCQSVIDSDKRENALRSADLQLTMVELRDIRYLEVRSRAAFKDPIARFSLRIGCAGEQVVEKEFTVLIDPAPGVVAPVATATAAAASQSAAAAQPGKIVVPSSGTLAVVEGDTLAKLAKAIYPNNGLRQRQYIVVLRELNEELGNVADNAPLPGGTRLALPDLLTLSGILPSVTLRTAPKSPPPIRNARPVAIPAASEPAAAAENKAPAPASVKPAPPRTTAPKTAPVKPAPVVKPMEAPTTPPARIESAKAQPDKTETVKPVAKPAENQGFHLRLSGAQMDLTRSRNVSEAQREMLREKQLILDSDDQVAALLSLKNTVKQLEQRLNEIQLKTSTTTAIPPAAAKPAATVTIAPAAPAKSPDVVAVTPTAPATTATPAPPAALPPPSATETEPAPAPAPPIADTPAKSSSPTAKPALPVAPASPPAEPSFFDNLSSYLPSPLMGGAILAGLIALFAAWAWARRSRDTPQDSNMLMRDIPPAARSGKTVMPPATDMQGPDSTADEVFAEWEGKPDGQAASPPADGADHLATVRMNRDEAPPQAPHQQIDAPVVFEDAPASYELDSNPATTVDFLVGMDEKLPEDRVRRLQYMHERYPEMKSNTVSIDDADSVINAARLYYDEADKSGGADKAAELLTFAVEERPQEIRYWLALFEIFRLENMVSEFSVLASKFHVLFSHTPAWPKVRHIGHEMDPGNTLFAAGGTATLTADTRFDPIAENWLNAPQDFTSDALMSDLRLALLDDHAVSRNDFESITARLSATSAGGA